MAAAMARQNSTSSPVQLPWASGTPKPARPVLEPQVRKPFCLTLVSVAWAEAPVAKARLDAVWQAAGQRDRCLDSLLSDGLVEQAPDGRFVLPGDQ
jgi:hypothetical protein